MIENFFKTVNASVDANTPVVSPVIDNVLIKHVNITLSRAVMTLAGTLEVQVILRYYNIATFDFVQPAQVTNYLGDF